MLEAAINEWYENEIGLSIHSMKVEIGTDMLAAGLLRTSIANLSVTLSKEDTLTLVGRKFDECMRFPPLTLCPIITSLARKGLLQSVAEAYDKL